MKSIALKSLALLLGVAALMPVADAHANSSTQIARREAQRAHAQAATATATATALVAQNSSRLAAFNAGMASSRQSTRAAARRTYLYFLRNMKRKHQDAERAHYFAIRAYQNYIRVSRNTAAQVHVNTLSAARARLGATINQIQTTINNLPMP